jgi:hypothetical protein
MGAFRGMPDVVSSETPAVLIFYVILLIDPRQIP